ncbi:glycosyltransferase family 2 protein [Anabaena sp. UHCC 0253]|uniref:glycosyltransferase family 2 protein n=1 Tax=Anabaena sp. UHCC 0253 TaxID=2590019 RepID=UPI001445226F|nr:glycosyltransferase family 2 protein [Anabaena sp. UHCC 0253]MTJ53683.1 glycosyltransferase family 2 protein [Anabaena sp. UHCC 0253]
MSERYPIISVIIPTYNYAHYIQQAIDSVLKSDFPQDQIEIIVIDDGSQDNTSEIVTKYGSRVKYILQENSGKAWATKVGIDNCQGKYVFNLDADDLFLPNKIKEVVGIFESDPEIVHVAHPALCWEVDNDQKFPEAIPKHIIAHKISGKELLSYFYRNRMLFGGGSTFAVRRDTLNKFSIPKEVDMYIDEYLVMCTLNQGYSYFIDNPLSVWRIHRQNYSGNTSNVNEYQKKSLRSLTSIEGILNNLDDFDVEIRKIYTLKYKISQISEKEKMGNKTLFDILSMWWFFLKNFGIFSYQPLTMIKSYTLLNRTLPNFILDWLRTMKHKKIISYF